MIQILEQFKWLKEITEAINQATSAISFQSTMGSIPIISWTVSAMFSSKQPANVSRIHTLSLVLHIGVKFMAICVAGFATSKVRINKLIILKHYKLRFFMCIDTARLGKVGS